MNSWQDIIQMIYTSEPKNDKKKSYVYLRNVDLRIQVV